MEGEGSKPEATAVSSHPLAAAELWMAKKGGKGSLSDATAAASCLSADSKADPEVQPVPVPLARSYAATHASAMLDRWVSRGLCVPHQSALLRSARGDRDLWRRLEGAAASLWGGEGAGTPRSVAASTAVDPVVLGPPPTASSDSAMPSGDLRAPLPTVAMTTMLHNPGLADGLAAAAKRALVQAMSLQ